MLQVKFFYYDLHKPKGAKPEHIEKDVNEWLASAGDIIVLTEDAIPIEVTQGHIIWTIWYEDYNNKKEKVGVSRSLATLDF
jgi:hypothetical protein